MGVATYDPIKKDLSYISFFKGSLPQGILLSTLLKRPKDTKPIVI